MSSIARQNPWFAIRYKKLKSLEECGCYPWVFAAETILQFVKGTERRRQSEGLSFRLDTGAFLSLIPEVWLTSKGLDPFLKGFLAEMPFATAAGSGSGRLARVSMQFAMAPDGVYDMDVLVSPNLNGRDYGLMALRDVVRHFDINTQGHWSYDATGKPIDSPRLILTPHH